jgi:hypothetical protein
MHWGLRCIVATAVLGGVLCAVSACTPALNWREVRLDDGATASLPCRPEIDERTLQLAGRSVQMRLRACDAGDAMWAVSTVQAAGADHAQAVMAELQRSLAANLNGPARVLSDTVFVAAAGRVADLAASGPGGMASLPGARSVRRVLVDIAGRHPDGAALPARALFVSHANHIWQLVVLPRAGARAPAADAQDYFADSLRVGPPASAARETP